jgi:hypothetical protein
MEAVLPRQSSKPPAWMSLAKQVTEEHDTEKLLTLVEQLCKALSESSVPA